jgi:hypothetical protein
MRCGGFWQINGYFPYLMPKTAAAFFSCALIGFIEVVVKGKKRHLFY